MNIIRRVSMCWCWSQIWICFE